MENKSGSWNFEGMFKRFGIRRSPFRLLLDPKFQIKIIAVQWFSLALMGVAVLWWIHTAVQSASALAMNMGLGANHPLMSQLHLLDSCTTRIVISFAAGDFLVSTLFILRLTHRLVGPIYRLKAYLAD